jgi:hypothetical protein
VVERDGETERERGREGERDLTHAGNQEGKAQQQQQTGRKRGHEKTRYTRMRNLGHEEVATISK